jgi:Cu(I)/Ag(I) efflux system membrane fusion protein
VTEGEKVVVGANFLIDAESNLRAALQNFAAPQSQGKSP